MSYDLHGTWESTTNHNAPLRADDNISVVCNKLYNIMSLVFN